MTHTACQQDLEKFGGCGGAENQKSATNTSEVGPGTGCVTPSSPPPHRVLHHQTGQGHPEARRHVHRAAVDHQLLFAPVLAVGVFLVGAEALVGAAGDTGVFHGLQGVLLAEHDLEITVESAPPQSLANDLGEGGYGRVPETFGANASRIDVAGMFPWSRTGWRRLPPPHGR